MAAVAVMSVGSSKIIMKRRVYEKYTRTIAPRRSVFRVFGVFGEFVN